MPCRPLTSLVLVAPVMFVRIMALQPGNGYAARGVARIFVPRCRMSQCLTTAVREDMAFCWPG